MTGVLARIHDEYARFLCFAAFDLDRCLFGRSVKGQRLGKGRELEDAGDRQRFHVPFQGLPHRAEVNETSARGR